MVLENFAAGFIVSFREGLEAFLIVAILLQFLNKSKNTKFKINVWQGMGAGIGISVVLGLLLFWISTLIADTGNVAKLWESGASLVAVLLIVTFIIWMIQHGHKIKQHVEGKAKLNLSKIGIFLLAMIMVLREGAEIVIFMFAGKYTIVPVILGLAVSVVVVVLIFYSVMKVKLSTIFNITLAYLILQAGFLAGYGVHEGLSAAKGLEYLSADDPIYNKAYDFSDTILNHKEGALGIPLYVGIGWYSKPEWIQFAIQYGLTIFLFWYWYTDRKKHLTKAA